MIGLQFRGEKASNAFLKSTASAATASLLSIMFLQSSVIFSSAVQQERVVIIPHNLGDKTL